MVRQQSVLPSQEQQDSAQDFNNLPADAQSALHNKDDQIARLTALLQTQAEEKARLDAGCGAGGTGVRSSSSGGNDSGRAPKRARQQHTSPQMT